MRHDLRLSGEAFRIRPIGDADAEFVVSLRCNSALNHFLHATSPSVDEQLAWLALYYGRPDDYYFVIEKVDGGECEGLLSVYDIDSANATGEWGRWILRPQSLAAVESVWLVYRCAFDLLRLKSVYCRTVADNTAVVSFHDSCGIARRRLLPGHFDIAGRRADAIEHHVDGAAWATLERRLAHLALLTARRIRRG